MPEVLTFTPKDMFDQLRRMAQIPALTEKIIAREILTRARTV